MMRRPDQHGIAGPSLRIAGEIRSPARYATSSRSSRSSNWKGELVVIEERKVRSLYFDQGNCIAAHTNVPEERLGEDALSAFGVVTREATRESDRGIEHERQSLRRDGDRARLRLTRRLYPMMARQVEEVFYAALHVADGMFYFFDKYDEAAIGRRHKLERRHDADEGALVAWTR